MDVKLLINQILSDEKLAGKNQNEKIYSDEPLLFTAAQMREYTPPKYLEMRRIAGSGDSFYQADALIFLRQAEFMAEHEDDFDYHGEFVRYYPTYQSMNTLQLRGYFSWRTDVRKGIIAQTSLSFVFVYIYELINQIGVDSPLDGYYKLKKIVDEYGKIDSKLNYYAELWLRDYVIYYGLDVSLLEGLNDSSTESAVLTLMNADSHTPDEVFDALCSLSSYNLKNSPFYKKNKQDVQAVVCRAFTQLTQYFAINKNKNNLCQHFFGKPVSNAYAMFRSAVFCEQTKHADCIYEVSPICKYTCRNGFWYCEELFIPRGKNSELGKTLKYIDASMRMKCGFKSTLKLEYTTQVFAKILGGVIDSYYEEKHRSELPVIEIDVTKLGKIRADALTTQEKLTVEDATEAYAPPRESPLPAPVCDSNTGVTPQSVAESDKTACPLSPLQLEYVKLILNGESCTALARKNGTTVSILADETNEAVFDIIGDTAIELDGDTPTIIEDYLNELKGLAGL